MRRKLLSRLAAALAVPALAAAGLLITPSVASASWATVAYGDGYTIQACATYSVGIYGGIWHVEGAFYKPAGYSASYFMDAYAAANPNSYTEFANGTTWLDGVIAEESFYVSVLTTVNPELGFGIAGLYGTGTYQKNVLPNYLPDC